MSPAIDRFSKSLLLASMALLAACQIGSPISGGGREFATVVENTLDDGLVIGVADRASARYYPAPGHSVIVVDTVDGADQPITSMTIYDAECETTRQLPDDYSQGARVTIQAGDSISIEVPHSPGGSEGAGASSCAEAALRL